MGQDRIGLSDNPTNQNPPSPEMDRRRGGHFLVCAPHTGFPNEIKTKFSPREKSVAARFGVSLSVLDTGRSLGGFHSKIKINTRTHGVPEKKHRKEIQESLELGCGKHMARDGVGRVERRIGNFYFRRGRGKGEKAVSETSLSSKFRTAAALSFPIQFSTERRRSKE